MTGLRAGRIAVPVVLLVLVVLRLVLDPGDAGDWWVYPVGLAVGLVVVAGVVVLALRLTRRRRMRALPVAERLRRDGATAYVCTEGGGTSYLVLAVGRSGDLDLVATAKGRADPLRRLPAGATR